MVIALRLRLRNHQLLSNPFSTIVRIQRTPLFQVQPIQTSSLSPLQLKTRRKSLKEFNASYVECLERSNSYGGGEVETVRVFLRWVEFSLGSKPENKGMVVVLVEKVALFCAQVIHLLHLVFMEIGNAFVENTFVSALIIAAAITFVLLHYF